MTDSPDPLAQLKAATGRVMMLTGARGTGYLVAPSLVATCHHVVKDFVVGDPLHVVFGDEQRKCRLLGMDPQTDAALLRLEAPLDGVEPLPISGAAPPRGSWDGYGFPMLAKTAMMPLRGDVLDAAGTDDLGKPALILFSSQVAAGMAAPLHGFSGSPVMVDGVVVGQIARILSDPDKPDRPALGLVFATPARAILDLAGAEIAAAPSPEPGPAPAPMEMLEADEYHVFISYRSTDRAWVLQLVARLEGLGLRVFLNQHELEGDDGRTGSPPRAIDRSRAAIAVISEGWIASVGGQRESDALIARAARDPSFRLGLIRLDGAALPGLWAGRNGIDFQSATPPSGPALEVLLRTLAWEAAPAQGSPEAQQRAVEATAVDQMLAHLRAASAAGAGPLFRAWGALRGVHLAAGAPALLASELLLGHNRPDLALVVLDAAHPGTRASQLRALALDRRGRSEEAIEILAGLMEAGQTDGETGGLLGGRYKARWLRSRDPRWLRKAYAAYRDAYRASGDSYPGINAAAMALQLDEIGEARKVAGAVVASLEARLPGKLDHWSDATLAEAYLLLDDLDKARTWYQTAVEHVGANVQDIAVMRRGARLALSKLCGRDAEGLLDADLSVPRVIVYTGHLTDAPDRTEPRFPPEREGAVRIAIRARLAALGVGWGYGSLARGADVLFVEELLDREARVFVTLPFPAADFAATSVGKGWDERFYRLLADPRVEVRPPLHAVLPPPGAREAAFQECNLRVQEEAVAFARTLDETPVLIAVLRENGGGHGGTSDAVRAWRARGLAVEIIDPMRIG